MNRRVLIIMILLGSLALVSSAYAVGSGGGGSVPSCTEDLWNCTGWSQCSASGTQARMCSITFDCDSATTARPPETQNCTPPATTPIPVTTTIPKEPKSTCTKDVWNCDSWSKTCDTLGREQRTCTLATDCPGVETPPPTSFEVCSHLQCGNLSTLAQRVDCRINLAPAGAARELAIKYLPEACRVLSGTEQTDCVGLYKSFQSCWKVEEGDKRFSCAQNVLKLGGVLSDEVKTCEGKTGASQVQCKKDVKEKALYMISFRFYDLESRAEALISRGADAAKVAAFDTIVETKKQEFNKATTNTERKQIVLDIRHAWTDFVNQVKSEVK